MVILHQCTICISTIFYQLFPASLSLKNCFDFFMVPKDRENKWAALNKKKKKEMNFCNHGPHTPGGDSSGNEFFHGSAGEIPSVCFI